MITYYISNDGFTANDSAFYNNKFGHLNYTLQNFQLIVYAIINITKSGTAVPLYKFVAKHPKKRI